MRTHGPMSTRGLSLKEKLTAMSRRSAKGCLIWRGPKAANGLGRIWWNGQNRSVGRLAFELAKGPLPKGAMVLHRCGSSLCIEPKHFFAGYQAALSAKIKRRLGEEH